MAFATVFVYAVLQTYVAVFELIYLDTAGAKVEILNAFIGADDGLCT